MKVNELIDLVDDTLDNSILDGAKVIWINELEGSIYRDIVEEFDEVVIDIVAVQEGYVTTDYKFEDIKKVSVNGIEYSKQSLAYNEHYSYYKKDGKITLNPIPSIDATEGLKVIHRHNHTRKTLAAINTQDLELTSEFKEEFANIYEYFISYKICLANKDNDDANNYGMLYNEALASFTGWYLTSYPKITAIKRKGNTWR